MAGDPQFAAQCTEVVLSFKDLLSYCDGGISALKLLDFEKKFTEHADRIAAKVSSTDGQVTDIAAKNGLKELQQACYTEIYEHYTSEDNIRMTEMIQTMRNINSAADLPSRNHRQRENEENPTSVVQTEEEAPVLKRGWGCTPRDFLEGVKDRIPPITWIPQYNRHKFLGDMIAALAVGLMIIPQGMAYALLAGMPPIYGLYTAFTPLIIYFVFGSSRELAIGPTAMVSLILPTAVGDLAVPQTDEYIMIVIFFAFVYGILMFLLGLLKIGTLLENILSRPALSGFTQGASILIACSQLKSVLGYHPPIPVPYTVDNLIHALVENFPHINWWTALIGIPALVIILVMKKVKKTFPTIILILCAGIYLSYQIDVYGKKGIEIVGSVPPGLPKASVVSGITDRNLLTQSIGSIVVLTFVGYAESISVAKKFAAEHQYNLSVNQELFALGLCNIICCWFQAYPVAGSLPRTVVNAHTGSKTPLATLVASGIVALMLSFGTPLIYYTPLCILGAIVMSAALSIVDFSEPKYLWKIGAKADCASFILTWIATAFFGPILGVATAGLVSLCQVIYHSGRPDVYEEGRLVDTYIFKNVLRFPKALLTPGIVVIGLSAPRLSFYNFSWFRTGVETIEANYTSRKQEHVDNNIVSASSSPTTASHMSLIDNDINNNINIDNNNNNGNNHEHVNIPLEDLNTNGGRLHTMVFDFGTIEDIDGTCILYLLEMRHSYKQKNIALLFAQVKSAVIDQLRITGIVKGDEEHRVIFSSVADAVQFASGHKLSAPEPTSTQILEEKYPVIKLFTADYNVDENLITF